MKRPAAWSRARRTWCDRRCESSSSAASRRFPRALMTGSLVAKLLWFGMVAVACGAPPVSKVAMYHLKSNAKEEIVDGLVEDHASIARFCAALNEGRETEKFSYFRIDEPEGWLIIDGVKCFM